MAGKPKVGLDYAGWSVNIFDGDIKIDKLLEAQGWIGFSIYFYLCQMAYKFDGYFYRWSYDDSATIARRMGGGVRSETVRQTVTLCLQIGLFDKKTFDRDGILTSKGIQRQFYTVIQKRRRKVVIADYWLLDECESEGLEMYASNGDLQPANGDLQSADGDSPTANATIVKYSKPKHSKGKEKAAGTPPPADVFADYAGTDAELFAALKDFEDMRKKINCPLTTDRARNMICNQLDELAKTSQKKIELLNYAILKCWKTLYPIKEHSYGHTEQTKELGDFEQEALARMLNSAKKEES